MSSSIEGSDEENVSSSEAQQNQALANATNETSSIIVELSLTDPILIRWVSPSWKDIIGSEPAHLVDVPISDCLADEDKTCFSRATETLSMDDSRSVRCKFWLKVPVEPTELDIDGNSPEAVEIDANGILIHDRMLGTPTHTMWVFTVVQEASVWEDGVLDPQLAEALLGGAEFLATFLQLVSKTPDVPMPDPLTCNICDRNIQPWFFEKHTALCIVSHQAESEVRDCHDHLREHRQIIADLLRDLEVPGNSPIYDGIRVTTPPASPVTKKGARSSPVHGKSKVDKQRKSQIRTAELTLDYCDLAIDISTPEIPDEGGSDIFQRIQSPDSRNRINQLQDWKRPMIEDEALGRLFDQTSELVNAKLNSVIRLHNTIHYSEKIRQEIDIRVQDLIDQASECIYPFGELEQDVITESESPALKENYDITKDSRMASIQPLSKTESCDPVDVHSVDLPLTEQFRKPDQQSSASISRALLDASIEHETRASSPLSQFPPVSGTDLDSSTLPSLPASLYMANLDTKYIDVGSISSRGTSRRNSPQDLESQMREVRISRGIYESPRRPSGGSRPPTGFSPSRRSSRAASRNRSSSLARDRVRSPGRKVLNTRLGFLDKEHLSPTASPTLSAADSSTTDTSLRDRRLSLAPPLSPRLPSIAPAARPAPPSIRDFDIIKPISKGAFGSVYLSKKRTTGDYYAIKVLKKADMIAKNQVTNIKAERAIMMAQTESPFIAKLYFTFQSKEYLYLVMEYLNGGDCAALIKQIGGLPEDWARRYMAEVVLGLEYLHSRGIIHRDLKPDNLLISHNGHLKLTDFGLSRVGLVGRQNRARTSSLTDAPDLLGSSQFRNPSSPSSSRSASFDYAQSGNSTPAITATTAHESRPSYFNLRERSTSNSDHSSEPQRSNSDAFTSIMSKLCLDDAKYESDDSVSTTSGTSGSNSGHTKFENASRTPSTSASTMQMPPPAMKLFDPKDDNRRFVGTPDYLAPETINGNGQDDMVDWWSLGVILFEFLYGYPPFHAQTPDEVFENILSYRIDWPNAAEELELNISEHAVDLMQRLMTIRPDERLGSQNGAQDIKDHPFFSGVVWENISEEEALFVPTPDHPEDTDYFDARGASNHVFEDDSDSQKSAGHSPKTIDSERSNNSKELPYSSKINMHNRQLLKRTNMPLSIPPHVRDRRHRNRRSSESGKDEFGSFTFKNLGVLEKQNLEAIKKLRSEQSTSSLALHSKEAQVHHRSASSSAGRSMSSASSLPSPNPISPSNLTRSSFSSSPLTSSQTMPSNFSRHRSRGSLSIQYNDAQLSDLHAQQASQESGSPTKIKIHTMSLPIQRSVPPSPRNRSFTVGAQPRPEMPFNWSSSKRISKVFDPETPSSSSDTEVFSSAQALGRAQKRRQHSKRLSSVSIPPRVVTKDRSNRTLNVLICEDNPVSRRVLEAMLTKLKCRIVSVTDGAQAVSAATGDVIFDIILTDIKVPRLSGIEVARLVGSSAGSNSTTPIVAMSSYSTSESQDMEMYFDRRLEKPLTIKILVQTFRDLLHDWAPPDLGPKYQHL